MTLEEFKHLKDGIVLYDAKQSRRYRRHITAIVQGHDKCGEGVNMYCEDIEEIVSYRDHLMWDIMPDDVSSLPFY